MPESGLTQKSNVDSGVPQRRQNRRCMTLPLSATLR